VLGTACVLNVKLDRSNAALQRTSTEWRLIFSTLAAASQSESHIPGGRQPATMAKKNREVATPAAPGKGAAPAPEMPQMGQFVKQLAILPVMWGAGTVDFTKPDNLLLLRTGFCLAMGIAYLMVTFAIFRCKKLNDGTRVQNPGTNMYIKDEDKAADGSVSVRVYDTSKLQETKMRLVFSLAIAMFLHLQWEYTQPLLVMGARAATPTAASAAHPHPINHLPRPSSPRVRPGCLRGWLRGCLRGWLRGWHRGWFRGWHRGWFLGAPQVS
jgi:hypothetical protein